MMHLKLLAVLSCVFSTTLSVAVPPEETAVVHLLERQMNASSICTTSGVDYQDGGNYTINTNSNEPFTFISTFQGCNNDTAEFTLVNENTGDQYDCGQVPTVPDNTPQTATCPVSKNQLTSGKYLIIVLGNNGNGQQFASQREFTINAGPQQNTTSSPTSTTTITPTPTSASTTMPERVTTTQFATITRWSDRYSSVTVTATPTCRGSLDPACTFVPQGVQLPKISPTSRSGAWWTSSWWWANGHQP